MLYIYLIDKFAKAYDMLGFVAIYKNK